MREGSGNYMEPRLGIRGVKIPERLEQPHQEENLGGGGTAEGLVNTASVKRRNDHF